MNEVVIKYSFGGDFFDILIITYIKVNGVRNRVQIRKTLFSKKPMYCSYDYFSLSNVLQSSSVCSCVKKTLLDVFRKFHLASVPCVFHTRSILRRLIKRLKDTKLKQCMGFKKI